ncbi:MAG: YhfC family intramembrane metalloprotease [Lachnospiraceae bacterium]|nr:YhfC family intramembrane metalloprotease [Lachnospiraceae bacterium]
MLLFSLVIGIVICYGLPVAGLVMLVRKKKGTGKAFCWGVLAFVVSQLLIRIPILQLVLPQFTWFSMLPLYSWGYGLFLGVTAGLAEESARWAAVKCFLKEKRSFEHGLAFGLGHGGIEAMLLVGPNMIAGVVMTLGGQGTSFPADWGSILTAGAERIFAVAFHVGASLLIMYGVREGKALWYWILAVALHTVLDAAVVILPRVFGVGILGIEFYAALCGSLTLMLGVWVYHRKGKADSA